MNSCEAAITLGSLVGAGIGLAATILFILAAAAPAGASRRRHVLWLLALVAVWGAHRAGPELAPCYAAALSLVAAIVIGLTLIALIAAAANQIGKRSVK